MAESVDPELITIVEGPTPDFHLISDSWAFSVLEGQSPYMPAACQVRSYNGEKLLERCQRAWREARPIRLDYRQLDGLRCQIDIIGARLDKVEGVDVLNLWVRQPLKTLMASGNKNDDLHID